MALKLKNLGKRGISIDPRPGVKSIGLYAHLNYEPWYAIAEFVDNAIDSLHREGDALRQVEGDDFVLEIYIDVRNHGTELTIRDNAGGIATSDYARAFSPAAPPPDRSGLSEFGIGMKSAGCWFANTWEATTSALGEPVQRTIMWDVKEIVDQELGEIPTQEYRAKETDHYTELTMHDLRHPLVGRTVAKIKEYLAEIYRDFLRRGHVAIFYNGIALEYAEPEILEAPYYETPKADPQPWRREVAFEFGPGYQVTGFVGLLAKLSNTLNGFSLFRRGRIIEGLGDAKYKPLEFMGAPSTFRHRRLFGELHLEGLTVSHQKDKFVWGEHEAEFLNKLKEALKEGDHDLYVQAEQHRTGRPTKQTTKNAAKATMRALERVGKRSEQFQESLTKDLEAMEAETVVEVRQHGEERMRREFELPLGSITWKVRVMLIEKPEQAKWIDVQVNDTEGNKVRTRELDVYVSASHPFVAQYNEEDSEAMESILLMGLALAIGEQRAKDAGAKQVGYVREFMNDLLRGPFSGDY